MMFLSLCIVYWLLTLFHWYDNNAVFIVHVSRAYANTLPQKIGKKQINAYKHTLNF